MRAAAAVVRTKISIMPEVLMLLQSIPCTFKNFGLKLLAINPLRICPSLHPSSVRMHWTPQLLKSIRAPPTTLALLTGMPLHYLSRFDSKLDHNREGRIYFCSQCGRERWTVSSSGMPVCRKTFPSNDLALAEQWQGGRALLSGAAPVNRQTMRKERGKTKPQELCGKKGESKPQW